MKLLDNFFKPTPKKIKKIILAFKTSIGTIAGAVYFQDKPKIAFFLLVFGAFLDFIIDSVFSEEPQNN